MMKQLLRAAMTVLILALVLAGTSALADTSWYTEGQTEFDISTADQLMGLSELSAQGRLAEGITIRLTADIDLAGRNYIPVALFRNSVFDGQGHTIRNLTIDMNTSALAAADWYYALGLFDIVEDSTVKNLRLENIRLLPSGNKYYLVFGFVAARAYGDATFENITIRDSFGSTYNSYGGGVMGFASGDHITVRGLDIDASNVVESLWESWDSAVGGVAGWLGSSTRLTIEDSFIGTTVNAYNDVAAAYRWYRYRYAGMLVGRPGSDSWSTNGQLSTSNVEIAFGDWNQYVYCGTPGERYTRVDPDDSSHTHDATDEHITLPMENIFGGNGIGSDNTLLSEISTTAGLGGVNVQATSGYGVDVLDGSASVRMAQPGQTVTLTAQPKAGMLLERWKVLEGNVQVIGNSFVMGNEYVRVQALYTAAQSPDLPRTGDSSRIALWLCLMAASVTIASGVRRRRA